MQQNTVPSTGSRRLEASLSSVLHRRAWPLVIVTISYFWAVAALLALLALATVPVQGQIEVPPVPVNPLLQGHSAFFEPRQVYDLQEDPYLLAHRPPGLVYEAYSAVGYNLANAMLVKGPTGGLVVIDAMGSVGTAAEVIRQLREAADLGEGPLPIEAIVYTHNHIDHTGGVQAFLDAADRPPCPPEETGTAVREGAYVGRGDCVEIFAQEKLVSAVVNTATIAGQIINTRSAYMYGNFLGRASAAHPDQGVVNDGIGPFVDEGAATFRLPSKTFGEELQVSAAGVSLLLTSLASETADELVVFLPDVLNRKPGAGGPGPDETGARGAGAGSSVTPPGWGGPGLLFAAEVIQGPAFPNLYSLRGTAYRNPSDWFRSVDRLRQFDSWCMVPSHGPPLCGEESIQTLLLNFRDAIQYTHDQTVRLFNLGFTADQIAATLRDLPAYFLEDLEKVTPPREDMDPRDYLRPFYGSVSQSVREIYFGYLGWFQADPVALYPMATEEESRRFVAAVGGREQVLGQARKALGEGRAALAETTEPGRIAGLETCLAQKGRPDEACRRLEAEVRAGLDGAAADLTWSARLTAQLVRVDHGDAEARELKAQAYLGLAEIPMNPNWRNWYVSAAIELLGELDGLPALTGGLVSPAIVTALPTAAWVDSWTLRLEAEKSAEAGRRGSLALRFRRGEEPVGPYYALHLRRAVCQFEELGEEIDEAAFEAVLSLSHGAWEEILNAEAEAVRSGCGVQGTCQEDFARILSEAFRSGGLRVLHGTEAAALDFFSYFDPRPVFKPSITVR